MTQEEKQLLFKDLCARLPYGVKVYSNGIPHEQTLIGFVPDIEHYNIKPYLRPMSSMTEGEKDEVKEICTDYLDEWEKAETLVDRWKLDAKISYLRSAFYNSHHLDWNGLIPMRLAIEAPEGMYN